MLRLVRHYSSRLGPREWEMIFHILHATQRHLSQQVQLIPGCRCSLVCVCVCVQAELSSAAQLQSTLQDIFSSVEQFWKDRENSIGPVHLFFQLLDEVRVTLPVSAPSPPAPCSCVSLFCKVTSVLSLLHYQSQTIDAAELDWLPQISLFMDKFFRSVVQSAYRYDGVVLISGQRRNLW